jgi:peptidoglycan DL-endopeptidase CwlO
VLAEIQAMDAEMEKAVEAFNAANVRLDQIKHDLAVNQSRLVVAKKNLAKARAQVSARLVALYTSDEPDTLSVIFGASSLGDLIERIDSANRIADEDARIAAEVKHYRNEVQTRQQALVKAQADQEKVVADRAAQRASVQSQLAERQALYSSIKDQIAQLEAAERARQARLAAQAKAAAKQQSAPAPAPAPAPSSGSSGSSGGSSGASAPPPATHSSVVSIALQYLGVPYVWGGASPSGFDCSGLTMYAYAKVGVYLPHNAAMQYGMGTPVSRSQLAPGDLVFFSGLSHVGMYIGGGRFVHAPHTGDVVKISSLSEYWYSATYVGARRY